MLVLTRRKDESIRIGDDVVVTVVRIGKGSCKILIDAPRSIPIRRIEAPPSGSAPAAQVA